LIRFLYHSGHNGGLRVSELVTLRWRNLVEGVASVTGEGGKTRVVRLSPRTWAELQALRTEETFADDPVFPMSAVNAWKRGKRAARTSLALPRTVARHSRPKTGQRRLYDAAAVVHQRNALEGGSDEGSSWRAVPDRGKIGFLFPESLSHARSPCTIAQRRVTHPIFKRSLFFVRSAKGNL
jgi:hypothetical protein